MQENPGKKGQAFWVEIPLLHIHIYSLFSIYLYDLQCSVPFEVVLSSKSPYKSPYKQFWCSDCWRHHGLVHTKLSSMKTSTILTKTWLVEPKNMLFSKWIISLRVKNIYWNHSLENHVSLGKQKNLPLPPRGKLPPPFGPGIVANIIKAYQKTNAFVVETQAKNLENRRKHLPRVKCEVYSTCIHVDAATCG